MQTPVQLVFFENFLLASTYSSSEAAAELCSGAQQMMKYKTGIKSLHFVFQQLLPRERAVLIYRSVIISSMERLCPKNAAFKAGRLVVVCLVGHAVALRGVREYPLRVPDQSNVVSFFSPCPDECGTLVQCSHGRQAGLQLGECCLLLFLMMTLGKKIAVLYIYTYMSWLSLGLKPIK